MKVVELQGMDENAVTHTYARFVLRDGGDVEIVGVTAQGKGLAEDLVRDGIRGPEGRVLTPKDGELFLKFLAQAFRGTRLWANDVREMSREQLEAKD
jgi:hypothetical protein